MKRRRDPYSSFDVPVADFTIEVDGEVVETVEAADRREAGAEAAKRMPHINTLAYQGRVRITAGEHECQPAAGNISVCCLCQAQIPKEDR